MVMKRESLERERSNGETENGRFQGVTGPRVVLSGALASCVYGVKLMIISELLVDAEDSYIRLYSKPVPACQVSDATQSCDSFRIGELRTNKFIIRQESACRV
jgi:hypothetical protein